MGACRDGSGGRAAPQGDVRLGRRVLYLLLTGGALKTCAAILAFAMLWALIVWWGAGGPGCPDGSPFC